MIINKLRTSIFILKNYGLLAFLKKFRNLLIDYIFVASISKITKNEISQNYISNIIKTLSKAVLYTFQMDVQGDIAEFGTMTGRTAISLATAVNTINRSQGVNSKNNKKIHFFDSFEGLPPSNLAIDKNSIHVKNGKWVEGKCKGLNATQFTKLISKYLERRNFIVYKGWFNKTLSNLPSSTKLSLIHIDSDLYESAIDVLEYLFKNRHISNGSVILFDDWNCNAADPNFGERRAFKEVCDKFSISFSDEGSYGIAGHKFIIHDYKDLRN